MINIIIINTVFGMIIGIVAAINKEDEPIYIAIGGIVMAVLITYPVQMAIFLMWSVFNVRM